MAVALDGTLGDVIFSSLVEEIWHITIVITMNIISD